MYPLFPNVLSTGSGTFEVVQVAGGSALRITATDAASFDPQTGTLVSHDLPENVTAVYLSTLHGDELSLWPVDAGPVPADGSWWRYQRMACP